MKTINLNIIVVGINLEFQFKVPLQMKIKDLISLCVELIEENRNISIQTPSNELILINPLNQKILDSKMTVIQCGLKNNEKIILI